ncbi:MFS transporter [Nocardioides marinquilinus]|uniref:MFS transporter n=1 Tax=Nocardioides marinquilinus TaxID=1210400 RepID=A0ABP9PKZ1_9ACTN
MSTGRTTNAAPGLFSPELRAVTVGLVLLISLIAFENMGVSTAMPALIDDLGTTDQYAWPFVAFVAANVVGTVLGGRWCDAHGPRTALLAAPAVFGLGLLVAGLAPTMAQLLAGRVLQGLGAGAQGVAVYVLIAAVYAEAARPAVFGLISSAWVLPSLIGPPVAGVVTETFSWHWVFLGLLPLVVLATALVVPVARRLGPPSESRTPVGRVVPYALAAALGVAALSWAGQETTVTGAVVAAVALLVLLPSLQRLVPPGTLRARPGVAAVVAARGLLSGGFFAVTAMLPLVLTDVHGWSLAAAGTPLIAGSLGWSASAAWQGRRGDLPRGLLLRVGFGAIAVASLGLLVVTPEDGVPWLALPLWAVAGLGMGLAFSSLSFLLLRSSATAEVGANSAAAQLTDGLAQSTFVGLGGALLVLTGSTSGGVAVLLLVVVGLATTGATISGRAAADRRTPAVRVG